MSDERHITKAASILLTRAGPAEEVYVVRRAAGLRFLGGFLAFPGGKVSRADEAFPAALSKEALASPRYPSGSSVAAARSALTFQSSL